MRARDVVEAGRLAAALGSYEVQRRPLLGIASNAARETFVAQIIESQRRVAFVRHLGTRALSENRMNSSSSLFDPIMAAKLHQLCGNTDESFWLVFLSIHFGKNRVSGWQLVRDVYGALGQQSDWTWERVSADPQNFRLWLGAAYQELTSGVVHRAFGNHRKYETLMPGSNAGTPAVVESYIAWVADNGGHESLFGLGPGMQDLAPEDRFKSLFRSMDVVRRFGRTARFDYLSMVGNLELANIRADRPYLEGATGPLRGARLLLEGSVNAMVPASIADAEIVQIANALQIGMQEVEDALCNWQKSPREMKKFRG